MDMNGQLALVTGGGSGLGAATARRFASAGAKVAILDFDADKAEAVAAELGGLAIKTDVSREADVAAAFDAVAERFGEMPRIAVNCAGIGLAAKVVGREGKLGVDLFERTIGVNLIGTFIVMSYAARGMSLAEPLPSGERGVIINTASIAWQDGQMGQAAYAASKGGIAAMCLPAARDLARSAVRVMAIAPGLFHTPMMEGLPPEVSEKITANIPFPARLGQPEEYARTAQQIVENTYLNGTTIRLDAAARLPAR